MRPGRPARPWRAGLGARARREGRAAEWIAALFLMSRGYRLLGFRLRGPGGEIDLLARRGPEVLVHLGPAGVGSAFVAVAAATASVRKVVSVHPALVPDLAAARDRHHLDFTVLHVAAEVHGPRRRDGVVAALLAGAPVPGPPAREVPLLAVDDVVDALVRAMVRGGGLALDVPGVALPLASVAAALGVLPVWTDDGPAAPAHGGPPVDGRRCRTYLGWRPFSDPAEALAATARWWRER